MEWDVSGLAGQTGLSVDTVRYYQSQGLLHPPEKRGRRAIYDDTHRERLERIRTLAARGFSLKAISALLEAGDASESDRRLLAAIERESGEARFDADELAERAQVPRAVLAAVERAGLAEGEVGAGDGSAFTESDVRVAAGAARLLRYGFPISRLITLAVKHDRAVRKTVDGAIELFDQSVRKPIKTAGDDDSEAGSDAVADAFRDLLPVVTALVAHHFQRVLVNRALRRLKRSGTKRELEAALEATSRNRVGVRF